MSGREQEGKGWGERTLLGENVLFRDQSEAVMRFVVEVMGVGYDGVPNIQA